MSEREQHSSSGPFPDSGGGSFSGHGPFAGADLDTDFDEWTAWLDQEVAAGRDPVPLERAFSVQGISVSLGDADGIDPVLLAAISGRECLGEDGLGSQFAQHAAADALPPGPALAALTEAAVRDVTRLSDDQLVGVLQAARRQENREAWKKALVIAEFARRREAEFKRAEARDVPVHCRPGQFPGEELAIELVLGPVQASHAIDDATDLTTRLPQTLAGMAAGLIDEARAGVIALYTRSLTSADAALADGILAALAPTVRVDQLARRAAALEMRLAPEAVRARKEHARRTRQRVEVRREESGNATVAGREMDTGDALAAKAHIHALALRLRRAGLPGTLDQLRLLAFTDLTVGRNPLDRLGPTGGTPEHQADPVSAASGTRHRDTPAPAAGTGGEGDRAGDTSQAQVGERNPGDVAPREAPAAANNATAAHDADPADSAAHADDADDVGGQDTGFGDSAGSLDYQHEHDVGDADDPPPGPRPPAPMPALINLVVHAGTLFGWDTTPAEAGGWGLLDGDETRAVVAAASRHPATRWCATVIGPDGTALAHGCSPGQHPWTASERAEQAERTQQDEKPPDGRAPDRDQAARLAAFLRALNVTFQPVARDGCAHAAAEPRYTPSRKLTHLVRARTATCDAPGCGAQAVHADLDHTIAYPDGLTDQCNLGPKCRRHHKAKQTPGWKVEQPEPGIIRWTLPSGRTHTTRPTVYDIGLGLRH
jgi:hypothetical protein